MRFRTRSMRVLQSKTLQGRKKNPSGTYSWEAFTVVDEEGRHIAGGKHYTIYAGFSQPDAKSEELMGMSPVKVEFRKR